ncbi:MAG: 4-hydroxy-tetrahydrodipicolinate reductase [Clostridia bacterium]|nr:4-hydroxy-tetrahydrodipicolinate reductase [Clostridia bacterium]
MEKKNVFVVGCNGRMGKLVCDLIQKSKELTVAYGFDMNTDSESGINVYCHPITSLPCPTDVIIDFSRPDATMEILPLAVDRMVPMVIATTGFTDLQEESIKDYAKLIPIFKASNMSYGVNAVKELLKLAAQLFYDYDIEINEFHHRNKADAPSGTANMFFDTINASRNDAFVSVYGRTEKRTEREIGISSNRGGAFPGEHTVTFAGSNDFIRIQHFAHNPSIFAEGALNAALYIMEQTVPRIYTMDDYFKM